MSSNNDYKDTLNLPHTAFPMKANLPQREPELLQRWESQQLNQQLAAHWQGREKFVLHDGPPYANGELHVGHGVNKVLKDIVVKTQMLSGYAAPYVPGWDCHGLPIELNVEKKHGKPGEKISSKAFRQACREYAAKFVDAQRTSFRRLGGIGDWEHPYITMDFHYEANIIRALAKVFANGYVKQGYKPIFWCPACGSALAQAEVEYKDKNSPSIDVRFVVVDEDLFLSKFADLSAAGEGTLSVPIWTTTPWTLPANEAVALHPELHYQLISINTAQGKQRILLAQSLVETVLQRYGVSEFTVLGSCLGKDLESLLLQHPFQDRQVPMVLAQHVTIESGTGAVHTAPAHGPDDFEVGQRYDLPISNPVKDNGCFDESTPLFAGLHVFKANQAIIETLQQRDNLLANETVLHSYPHCWRHKTPLIFRTTPQWFINLDDTGLRSLAQQAISEVRWVPEKGEARIRAMVENNPDWCISRQRTWGTPIPVFIHKETMQAHADTPRLMEEVAKRVELAGIDAWYDLQPSELLGDAAEDYIKSNDVLDVWFDSGVTQYCVLQQPIYGLHFPAEVYLEGSDQHRGWFQSSLLTALAMQGKPPYKTVVTHGFTVDGKGHKMSKSLGNVVALDKAVKQYGADILRLWIASSDFHGEIPISDEIMKRVGDVYRRLRNTARFLLANLHDFALEKHLLAPADMLPLDRWVMDHALQLQQVVVQHLQAFQFHQACQKIHHFCAIELGSFYLDVIKDRQYTLPANHPARRSAQTAMYHVLEALTAWLAPILTFTAEEIWQHLPGERPTSVFLRDWYTGLSALEADSVMNADFWTSVMQVRNAVNKQLEALRADNLIGSGLQAEVTLYCDETLYALLSRLEDELRFVLITSSATLLPLAQASSDARDTEMAGLRITVTPSPHKKCARCWHYREDVGSNAQHTTLCARCVDNVAGAGENRRFT
jgi:isoleucyl-tRNA synthetase